MEKIDALLKYIEQHLDESFTIEYMAEMSHYHPNHLIRVFKQFTGSPPISRLLRFQNDSQWNLIISCGYSKKSQVILQVIIER